MNNAKTPESDRSETMQRPAERAEECFGIIVILDALGAKSLTLEGARKFLGLRDALAIDLPRFQDRFHSAISKSLGPASKDQPVEETIKALAYFEQSKHEVVTFGDSFIFLHRCKPENLQIALLSVAIWCQFAIVGAMEEQVFLRGALSVGSYLYCGVESNTVLGPAVADAASWCDRADWIGVIVTPSAGYYLEQSSVNPNELRHHTQFHFFHQQRYIKYPVPTKGNLREDLWTLMWPNYFYKHDSPDSIRNGLANIFAGASMPYGTESKYAHTWQYVAWLWQKSLDWEKQGAAPVHGE